MDQEETTAGVEERIFAAKVLQVEESSCQQNGATDRMAHGMSTDRRKVRVTPFSMPN